MALGSDAALLALAGLAGVADLRSGSIANTITYGGVISGLFLGAVQFGVAGIGAAALGVAAALAVGVPLFLLGGMGGGDVKLYAAVGALAGPRGLLEVALASLVIGSFAAVVLLVRRGELRRSLWSVVVFFATVFVPRARIVWPSTGARLRFGVCIALAAVGWVLARWRG